MLEESHREAASIIPTAARNMPPGVRQAREGIERLEQAIREVVPDWTLAPVVEALQAMRGIDIIGAVAFLAELGDLARFSNPRQVMGYLGPYPIREIDRRERQARRHHQGRQHARASNPGRECLDVPPPTSDRQDEALPMQRVPAVVREIAWKAQCRLSGRYRTLVRRGKRKTVAVTAVARELAGFIWAVSREITTAQAATK